MATEETETELPADLLESMDHLDSSLDNCKEILGHLTSIPLLDMKNKLEPIESARLDLTTAYTMNSLFWVYLVTQGVNVTEHPVKDELDRIKKYMSKVKDTEEKMKGATLKVNKEAAKRFIKSALWTEKDDSNENVRKKNEGDLKQEQNSTNETVKDNTLKRKSSEDRLRKDKKKKKKAKQD